MWNIRRHQTQAPMKPFFPQTMAQKNASAISISWQEVSGNGMKMAEFSQDLRETFCVIHQNKVPEREYACVFLGSRKLKDKKYKIKEK
jgi:hypothetical protein